MLTVKQLKEILHDKPDDMMVVLLETDRAISAQYKTVSKAEVRETISTPFDGCYDDAADWHYNTEDKTGPMLLIY